MEQQSITTLASTWVRSEAKGLLQLPTELFCQTRDVFQARLDKMANYFLQNQLLANDDIYLITALAGEIGNNSFDHNLGSWPDIAGVFFGYDMIAHHKQLVLADRGQGILSTLKKVKPLLLDDLQALETAFKEKISGRAPENRGNGLKFVRHTVAAKKIHLTFSSGFAQANLNQAMIIKKIDQKIQGCLAILEF
ncbi:MAG: hypothetical protein HYV33_05095 [Candidatus Kerfeldbacteria bacterium]|nr:hypothetical protein [Candidatus Kerfeldbacteria bacterium]